MDSRGRSSSYPLSHLGCMKAPNNVPFGMEYFICSESSGGPQSISEMGANTEVYNIYLNGHHFV